MSNAAQRAANQANAQLSTGPNTETGKAKSSLNAVKNGLTGATVLLPGDDAALYRAHVQNFMKHHQPIGEIEQNLVQSLADTEWRLLRIPALQSGIYALGRIEFANLFSGEPEAVRPQLIEGKIFLAYQRPLSNLALQENRLRRQREKDQASLLALQKERARQTSLQLDEAARLYIQAVHEKRHQIWEPREFGFEFSLADVEVRAVQVDRHLFAGNERQFARTAAAKMAASERKAA